MLLILLLWFESGCAHVRAGGFCWTRPGKLNGRSNEKLSLKRDPPLCFEGSPKRRSLAWARIISPKRDVLAWARPQRALCLQSRPSECW